MKQAARLLIVALDTNSLIHILTGLGQVAEHLLSRTAFRDCPAEPGAL